MLILERMMKLHVERGKADEIYSTLDHLLSLEEKKEEQDFLRTCHLIAGKDKTQLDNIGRDTSNLLEAIRKK